MKQIRKETAWKKSRKFGDVKGGRKYPKIVDNVFNRAHNLEELLSNETAPKFIIENPSRDFFFPINVDEIQSFLAKLPKAHTERLTHIWLRKVSKKDYEKEGVQGCFITGSGVRLIVLHPFPKDLIMNFGKKKPLQKILKWYAAFEPDLQNVNENWQLLWTEEKIKKYYLEGLLLHEIGHQVDSQYQRYWSKAYKNKAEQFADNYAYYWSSQIRAKI